jgi:gamma-tubulin complex component 3
VSSFKLAGALEAALRASAAAAEDPAVLARLRVKLLPHAAGERGWDVFSLEYRVDMPLSTVFTPTVRASHPTPRALTSCVRWRKGTSGQ